MTNYVCMYYYKFRRRQFYLIGNGGGTTFNDSEYLGSHVLSKINKHGFANKHSIFVRCLSGPPTLFETNFHRTITFLRRNFTLTNFILFF